MLSNRAATDPGERLLAGTIDIEHENLICGVEGHTEFPGQSLCPRIQVGLEDDDTSGSGCCRPTGGILLYDGAHCRQRGPNLGRMMRVVIKDPYPVGGTHQFESAAHALESGQAVEHIDDGCAGLGGSQDRRQRVQSHVPTGNRKPHGPRLGLARQQDVRHRAGAVLFPTHQGSGQVVGRIAAVAQHPDPQGRNAFGKRDRTRIVGAHHQRSPGPEPIDEGVEHRGVGLRTTEEVEVIGFDIGHHGDVRGVFQ